MLGSLIVSAQPAAAWNRLNCQWSSADIRFENTGATSTWSSASNAGIGAWNAAAVPINFGYALTGYNFKIYGGSYGNVGWSGYTSPTGHRGTNATCTNGRWAVGGIAVYLNSTTTTTYSAFRRKSVVAHELGHVLGLAHNNASFACAGGAVGWKQLMFYSDARSSGNSCGNIDTPQSDDTAGVNVLY